MVDWSALPYVKFWTSYNSEGSQKKICWNILSLDAVGMLQLSVEEQNKDFMKLNPRGEDIDQQTFLGHNIFVHESP